MQRTNKSSTTNASPVATGGFFQGVTPNVVQLQTTEAPIILRLRRRVDIIPNQAFNWELQRAGILERVRALVVQIMAALPPDSPDRETFINWEQRFLQNPLQNAQQRHQAALELEWLLFEQIETEACLRIAMDERQINEISRVLMQSQDKVIAMRTKYRAKAKKLLHTEITQETLQHYREFIGELFYEMAAAVSTQLENEREAVIAERNNTATVCRTAAKQIHEACMQSAETLEDLRQVLVERHKECQTAEQTHEASIQGFANIVKGSAA